jgi:hypothetical protein
VNLSTEVNRNKVRIGLPLEFYNGELSGEVVGACEYVMELLEEAGFPVIPVRLIFFVIF